MIGKDKLLTTLASILKRAEVDQSEAVFIGGESGLTRYANSVIHQNVFERNSKVYFRVALDKKIGVAASNSLVKDDLKRALGNAVAIARQQKTNPDFIGLPGPAQYCKLHTHYKRTGAFTPHQRAEAIKKVFDLAGRHNLQVYGSFATGEGEIAILNSNGVCAYQPVSNANINIIVMGNSSSGYADDLSRDVAEIDVRRLAETALQKCLDSKNPRDLEPGSYEVVLEPTAVGNLMEWLAVIGLGSKSFQEKTSFLSDRVGQKVMGENVTILDNGTDESGIAVPFDFEGVPKKKVIMVDRGVARGVVYDTISANREKKKSTGHALTPDATAEGGLPLNIFIKAGNVSLKKMVANVQRGVLVTRFHYINGFLDTPRAVMTGMTRDGTFLIENGKVKYGIKNLRFTQSIVSAFSSVIELSRERHRVASWWDAFGCITIPAMRISSFAFTGKTEF